ncbi:MAG: DUF2911 domain-containing protein [Bacteroidetes bacterium]|jgi:hypothetical protein|nr:DUF2911 domain-containing protein [Bacteroidota bacterium]
MKSLSTLFLTALIVGFLSQSATAQERGSDEARVSPNATVSQTIGTTEVMVTYGRPGVRDRDIFGGLVAFGEVWRTGANESTALVLSDDVMIEGEEVSAGTYSIYTIPGNDEWTIIINEKLSWGTQYDESMDYVRVTAEPEDSYFVEQFMIYFEDVSENSGELVLHWDDTKVPVTISTGSGM